MWNISDDGKTQEEVALAGIGALADFIKEIGLPATLGEMNIEGADMLRNVAYSCNITSGCCKTLTHEEIYEILLECR